MHLAHFSILSPHGILLISLQLPLNSFKKFANGLATNLEKVQQSKSHEIFLIMLISVAIASGTMVELDFAVTKIIPSTHFNAINFNCTLMYLKIRMYMLESS